MTMLAPKPLVDTTGDLPTCAHTDQTPCPAHRPNPERGCGLYIGGYCLAACACYMAIAKTVVNRALMTPDADLRTEIVNAVVEYGFVPEGSLLHGVLVDACKPKEPPCPT